MPTANKENLFIGLMSGTSVDGVDGVLASFTLAGEIRSLKRHHLPFNASLRQTALELNTTFDDEIHRSQIFANALADLYAQAVQELLADTGFEANEICAIGAHGQTVRHRPDQSYSVQLLNGARLCEKTAITTICDFRSRDIAAGGQGAPLVPAFHQAIFSHREYHRIILNLGGIANITNLKPGQNAISGFDTGPANLLLDLWCERHLGTPFDSNGDWARQGKVIDSLLENWLQEPFFALPGPKSTGRDLFNSQWVDKLDLTAYAPVDVQATLVALTADSIAQSIRRVGIPDEIFVCGGGVYNQTILQRLAHNLPQTKIQSTEKLHIDPMAVEALAFAWLAYRNWHRLPANLPSVTGALGPRLLGAIYLK